MHRFVVVLALMCLSSIASAFETDDVHLIDPPSIWGLSRAPIDIQDPPPDCGEESYKGTGRLRGLRALITGGDSGIGRAAAIAYAREGAKVAINYLPEEESDAQELVDVLEPEGLAIERIPGNLLNETFCTELVHEAHSRLGGLDILVNHAGFSGYLEGPNYQPISNQSTAHLEQVFHTNVFAGIFLTRAAVPLLPRGGSIIFTTSGMAAQPIPNGVVYGASKAAVAHMVRSLSLQLAEKAIRVNGVAPGFTYTPFIVAGGYTTEIMDNTAKANPFGRIEQPVELAPIYVDLAEPSATFVSGEIFTAAGASPGM